MTKKQYELFKKAHEELLRLSKQMYDVACDIGTMETAKDAIEEVLFEASDYFEPQPSEDEYEELLDDEEDNA